MAEILYQSNPKMFRSRPLLFLFWLALVAGGVYAIVAASGTNLRYAGLAAIAVGILALAVWWLNCKTTVVTVGPRDVSLRHGILSKSIDEVQLDRVRSVNVYQSLVQRIFRVGRLSVFTAGDTPEILVNGLPEPERLRILLRSASTAPGN
ncbi:MAG: hypothetical protein RL477_1862 [Pseudomonadota bacterium]|jgi:uncharacterized membrane protein YdbT with pleckstrin-like domain